MDVRVAAPAEPPPGTPVSAPPVAAASLVTAPVPRPSAEPVPVARPAQPVFAARPAEPGFARPAEPIPAGEPGPGLFAGPEPVHERPNGGDGDASRVTCTQAQLRRFIKSRPWVPMHELRRRFGIFGGDDDVSLIRVADRTLFIGLPVAEGRMVAELLTAGDVGHELSMDPETPVIVGVYPMRPVPRS